MWYRAPRFWLLTFVTVKVDNLCCSLWIKHFPLSLNTMNSEEGALSTSWILHQVLKLNVLDWITVPNSSFPCHSYPAYGLIDRVDFPAPLPQAGLCNVLWLMAQWQTWHREGLGMCSHHRAWPHALPSFHITRLRWPLLQGGWETCEADLDPTHKLGAKPSRAQPGSTQPQPNPQIGEGEINSYWSKLLKKLI